MILCAGCFFFNDTATTEIYTLSLHDALPISLDSKVNTRATAPFSGRGSPRWRRALIDRDVPRAAKRGRTRRCRSRRNASRSVRSEEHTSELQSRQYLVCRLLLEKKNNNYTQQ